MTKVLTLIGGLPRLVDTSAGTDPYDVSIEIVESNPTGNQLVGPISAGVKITLPSSQTYILGSNQLLIDLNGQELQETYDFTEESSSELSLTFELFSGDLLNIRIDHS